MYSTPQRVSKNYIPVFLLRNVRAWILLILIYSIGPLTRGEANRTFFAAGSLSLTILNAVLIGLALTVGLVLLFTILSYLRISWRIDGENVVIKKGILRRVNKSIPISKIQSVNITATLSERIFHTATVKIDTAGGEDDDGKIPCLNNADAAGLRDVVFQVKHGTPLPQSAVLAEAAAAAASEFPGMPSVAGPAATAASSVNATAPQDTQTVYRLPAKNLWLTGISNAKALVFGFLIMSVITQYARAFQDVFLGGEDVYGEAIDYAAHLALPLLLLIGGVFFAISWFVSVLAVMAGNYGFTVRNIGSKIEIEKGLFTHRIISIEKQRVQEIRIRQGFLRRLIGYAEITVKTAILRDRQNSAAARTGEEPLGTTTIHPFISLKEVDYFITMLLPDFAGTPTELSPLPPRAHFRSVRRYVAWTLIFLVIGWGVVFNAISITTGTPYFDWFAANLPGVLIPSAILAAFFWLTGHRAYQGKAVSWNEDFVVIQNGAWAREWARIPRRKIQSAVMRENPFQRRVQLATLTGTTGALAFPSLRDVDRAHAENYLAWVVTKKSELLGNPSK